MQKYDILGMIGEGAYGVVLKCRCNQNQQTVAIKKFKQSEQDDEIVKKTTMRQVKILKMIKHNNIVELREAFRKKGIVYLVFQYVQNNLLQVLERSPSGLNPDLIKSFMYQLVKGLAYMHSQGLVHRDVKPQNLLISDKKQLKICDFGFARQLKPTKQQQLTDYVATRWYRPPQLLVGSDYDYAIDMWAVGCIMGELIDGNPMFPGQNQLDQLFLIQKCIGPLTPDLKETFVKNQRFLGMRFPQIHTLETIDKRYLGKTTPKAINFMKSLLKMNPTERITATQALRHPYFEGKKQEQGHKKLSTQSISLKIGKSINEEMKYSGSPSVQQKKHTPTPYNLFIEQKEKTETTQPQFDRSSKIVNKKQQMANTKGFVGLTSKSLTKNSKIQNKYTKEKNISLEKHKNRDIIIKTQTGFYISNENSRGKYNYDKQNGIPVMTEEAEQDEMWQPSNQLPSILITNQKVEKTHSNNFKNQRSSGLHHPKTYH